MQQPNSEKENSNEPNQLGSKKAENKEDLDQNPTSNNSSEKPNITSSENNKKDEVKE